MREVHIKSPVWNGTRTVCFVGIARRRVVNSYNEPAKGNIRVWIDYKETDTKSASGWKLLYPFPFDIKCSEVIKYPKQVLTDYNRTVLHIIPISDLKENRKHRERTMTQNDFSVLKQESLAVKQETE